MVKRASAFAKGAHGRARALRARAPAVSRARTAQLLAAGQHLGLPWGAAGAIHALGKFTSSFINGQAQDVRWLINWAAIGIVDGALTSSWYALIQTLANGSSYGPVSKTLLMMMASSFLYTPVYCAYFLVLISLLEGQSWAGAMERVRADALAMLLNATKVCGAAALALARCRPPCGKQSGKPLTRQ